MIINNDKDIDGRTYIPAYTVDTYICPLSTSLTLKIKNRQLKKDIESINKEIMIFHAYFLSSFCH